MFAAVAPFLFLIGWWFVWLLPAQTVYARWKRVIYYLILTLLLLCTGIATLGVYYDMLYPPTVIVAETAVYIGPDVTYAQRGILPAGTQVRVMQREGSWVKLKQGNSAGWMKL